jgi:hypothetical protein
MGTRATYEVNGQVFYCHWDGYPAGAANRFAKMIGAMTQPERGERNTIDAIADKRGGATFAFIRGNDDAEPTEGHDAHGDTEHRYRVTDDAAHGLVIEHEAKRWDGDFAAWGPKRPLAEFINTRRDKEWGVPTIVTFADPATHWNLRKILATIDNAREIAANHRRLAERFDDGNPNKPHHVAQAEAWERAIAAADEPQAVAA